jgi:hypothetical protein
MTPDVEPLELYTSNVDSTQNMWYFLFTVAIGLIGFLATIKIEKLRIAFYIVLFAFIFCASANFSMISASFKRREAIYYELIKEAKPPYGDTIISTFEPPPIKLIYRLHIALDLLSIGTIIALYQIRKPKRK